jgi:hypothetical protein
MRCFAVAAEMARAARMEDGETLPIVATSLQRREVEFVDEEVSRHDSGKK